MGKKENEKLKAMEGALKCAEFSRAQLGGMHASFDKIVMIQNACGWLDAIIENLKKDISEEK